MDHRRDSMIHYFYLLNRNWMQARLRPALAESWRRRNFAPCADLCQQLVAVKPIPDAALIRLVPHTLAYDRTRWHALVGELLIFGAEAMPRLPFLLESLCYLLAPQRVSADPSERHSRTPIEQCYHGTRDLRFGGGWYRPDHAGWNDVDDVQRLLAFLRRIDPSGWSATALIHLPDDAERTEELAYVRDWWPELVAMYEQAHAADQVVVCERP